MQMKRLIYVSDAVLPLPNVSFDQDVLDDIHRVSNRNNANAGVTGILLYGSGHFMQLLEGPIPSVKKTFDRIARDTRHKNIHRLLREATQERLFDKWHMGVLNLETKRYAFSEPLTELLELPPEDICEVEASRVARLFREFSKHLDLDQRLKETVDLCS